MTTLQPKPSTVTRPIEQRASRQPTIDAQVGLDTETTFFTGYTDDLSEAGLFVATYELLPVGTELILSFKLPAGHRVRVYGHVVWLREARDGDLTPGMGIGFRALTDEDEAAIREFLSERPPMFYAA